ncbi:triose-phosphate isomerase [Pseudolysinimonas sp.]|uniref:triose-phosphate isomerase n=1 Tax=Pseudolysinimonas sp. TaxID=2680009 RepID=UPI003F81A85F
MTRPDRARPVVGVSLKAYFPLARARGWLLEAAEFVPDAVEFFVAPSYLAIADAVAALPDGVAAQDVSAEEPGPFTGEVTAAELAEAGVRYAEIGHAERRRLFGDTEEVVAAKTAAALRHGITPVLCVGETTAPTPDAPDAAEVAVAQLRSALTGAPAGRIIVAYEPVWAIGAAEPASDDHIRAVAAALREARREPHDTVVYGGSAGPGLLTRLGDAVDGIFLGRFAHDVRALAAVVDEAVAATR